jgi:hypothetical protein
MTDKLNVQNIADSFLRDIDQAIVEWFKTVSPVVLENRPVPVMFVSQERWALMNKNKGLRDEAGVIILPLITVRRLETGSLFERYVPKVENTRVTIIRQIATRQDDETKQLPFNADLMDSPIYQIVTMEYPTFIELNYKISLYTSYLSHANKLQENIWKHFDSGRAYFLHDNYYIFGMIKSAADQSNLDDFVDEKRIIRYEYSFTTHAPIIDKNDIEVYRTRMQTSVTFKEL